MGKRLELAKDQAARRGFGPYDVVILGAGVAGLSLARHLLLTSEKRILLVDRRPEVPGERQKVGEATVQLSGYYLSKVLDLEEHLLRDHLMKYNLRFYWKTAGRDNRNFEDYSQAYIRPFSNIASYQLDRNVLEAELLRLNSQSPRFTFLSPAEELEVELSEEGPHLVRFRAKGRRRSVRAGWIVDTSGRGRFLARRLDLTRPNPIRHSAYFLWVEGLLNIEKLTALSPREIRLKRDRSALGHAPIWLATNHFAGEGFWFWVIPLRGKTSLGLVFDNAAISWEEVAAPEKLVRWISKEFPLFARDLSQRTILHASGLKDFSYGCTQTLSEARWALSGESGRFLDPLYSPGGDFIALHNTLLVDAILTDDGAALTAKCRRYEQLLRGLYEAFVPSFAVSYDVLGDGEAFVLKYAWELAIYFSFYVFPFINDLFTDQRFHPVYLRRFSRLGPLNRDLQAFLSAFYQWKKKACEPLAEPRFFDFTEFAPLQVAEKTFYEVGLSAPEARKVLDRQLDNLETFARFIVAYASSRVVGDPRALTDRGFVESIDLGQIRWDPEEIRERFWRLAGKGRPYPWPFDPQVMERFRTPLRTGAREGRPVAARRATG